MGVNEHCSGEPVFRRARGSAALGIHWQEGSRQAQGISVPAWSSPTPSSRGPCHRH